MCTVCIRYSLKYKKNIQVFIKEINFWNYNTEIVHRCCQYIVCSCNEKQLLAVFFHVNMRQKTFKHKFFLINFHSFKLYNLFKINGSKLHLLFSAN